MDRNILEDELKALIEMSCDFTRGLSRVTSRLKIIKQQLNSLDNNSSANGGNGDVATTETSNKVSRSHVGTTDRATSPIVFRESRSTSISPYRFDNPPRIKIEEDEHMIEGDNEDYTPVLLYQEESTPSLPVSPTAPTQLRVLRRAHASGDVTETAPRLNATVPFPVTNALSESPSKPLLAGASRFLRVKLNVQRLPESVEKPAQCQKVKTTLKCSDGSNYSHNDTLQNETTCSSVASGEHILSEEYSAQENSIGEKQKVKYCKRGKMTEEERREYNRLRQAKYRARKRKARDILWIKRNAHLINVAINQTK